MNTFRNLSAKLFGQKSNATTDGKMGEKRVGLQLYNQGNTCYMNSALQLLYGIFHDPEGKALFEDEQVPFNELFEGTLHIRDFLSELKKIMQFDWHVYNDSGTFLYELFAAVCAARGEDCRMLQALTVHYDDGTMSYVPFLAQGGATLQDLISRHFARLSATRLPKFFIVRCAKRFNASQLSQELKLSNGAKLEVLGLSVNRYEHYTSLVKLEGEWHLCNDGRISKVGRGRFVDAADHAEQQFCALALVKVLEQPTQIQRDELFSRQVTLFDPQSVGQSTVALVGSGCAQAEIAKNLLCIGVGNLLVLAEDAKVQADDVSGAGFCYRENFIGRNRTETLVQWLRSKGTHFGKVEMLPDWKAIEARVPTVVVITGNFLSPTHRAIVKSCDSLGIPVVGAEVRGLIGSFAFGSAKPSTRREAPVNNIWNVKSFNRETLEVEVHVDETMGEKKINRNQLVQFFCPQNPSHESVPLVVLEAPEPSKLKVEIPSDWKFETPNNVMFMRVVPRTTVVNFQSFTTAVENGKDLYRRDRMDWVRLALAALRESPHNYSKAWREMAKQEDREVNEEMEDFFIHVGNSCKAQIGAVNAVIGGLATQEVMKFITAMHVPFGGYDPDHGDWARHQVYFYEFIDILERVGVRAQQKYQDPPEPVAEEVKPSEPSVVEQENKPVEQQQVTSTEVTQQEEKAEVVAAPFTPEKRHPAFKEGAVIDSSDSAIVNPAAFVDAETKEAQKEAESKQEQADKPETEGDKTEQAAKTETDGKAEAENKPEAEGKTEPAKEETSQAKVDEIPLPVALEPSNSASISPREVTFKLAQLGEEKEADPAIEQTWDVGMRYAFDDETMERIKRARLLVVGAGATGCELLKNLTQMGVATHESGVIHVLDNDTVTPSNLSRQFLYNSAHVTGNIGKAQAACQELRKMQPELNCEFTITRLQATNPFHCPFDQQNLPTALVSCVDSFKARDDLDQIAHTYNIPVFDCGTRGIQGNVIAVYPKKTTTLGGSVPRGEVHTLPCTPKVAMYMTDHAIHRALWILETTEKTPTLFQDTFEKEIKEWCESEEHKNSWVEKHIPHPLEMKSEEEIALKKRFETALSTVSETKTATFDKDRPDHMEFVHSAACLYARIFSLPQPTLLDVRLVAGKMDSAVITTTAIVSGLTALNLLRHLVCTPEARPVLGYNYQLTSTALLNPIPRPFNKPLLLEYKLTRETTDNDVCEAWELQSMDMIEIVVTTEKGLHTKLTIRVGSQGLLLKTLRMEVGEAPACWCIVAMIRDEFIFKPAVLILPPMTAEERADIAREQAERLEALRAAEKLQAEEEAEERRKKEAEEKEQRDAQEKQQREEEEKLQKEAEEKRQKEEAEKQQQREEEEKQQKEIEEKRQKEQAEKQQKEEAEKQAKETEQQKQQKEAEDKQQKETADKQEQDKQQKEAEEKEKQQKDAEEKPVQKAEEKPIDVNVEQKPSADGEVAQQSPAVADVQTPPEKSAETESL